MQFLVVCGQSSRREKCGWSVVIGRIVGAVVLQRRPEAVRETAWRKWPLSQVLKEEWERSKLIKLGTQPGQRPEEREYLAL